MSSSSHFQLLAGYNRWMNDKLYDAAAQLSVDDLHRNRGAFFGSIFGTLNHIAVGDTIWLKRFAGHPACVEALAPLADKPAPVSLDAPLFGELAALREYRDWLDELIVAMAASLTDETPDPSLAYANTKGVEFRRDLYALLVHFFNHQTHHRGQVTALLFQAGIDPGVTDLLALIPQIEG